MITFRYYLLSLFIISASIVSLHGMDQNQHNETKESILHQFNCELEEHLTVNRTRKLCKALITCCKKISAYPKDFDLPSDQEFANIFLEQCKKKGRSLDQMIYYEWPLLNYLAQRKHHKAAVSVALKILLAAAGNDANKLAGAVQDDRNNVTALHNAVFCQNTDFIKTLLNHPHINPYELVRLKDKDYRTPLYYAERNKNEAVVASMEQFKQELSDTKEQEACINELLYCLDLNKTPQDLDNQLIVPLRVFNYAYKVLELKLDTRRPWLLCGSLLVYCEFIQSHPTLSNLSNNIIGTLLASYLLKKNILLDKLLDFTTQETVLHMLAMANVNQEMKCKQHIPKAIAIVLAAANNQKQLLAATKSYFGQTALFTAAQANNTAAFQTILTTPGIMPTELSVMQTPSERWTVLHFAAHHNHKILVDILLSTPGINIRSLAAIKDKNGRTALDIARERNHLDIVTLLEQQQT